MVQVDETTQGVLNQISEGFEQKGAYNLRQNGIPLCHGDSEHIKIRKKEDKPGIDILIDGETKGCTVSLSYFAVGLAVLLSLFLWDSRLTKGLISQEAVGGESRVQIVIPDHRAAAGLKVETISGANLKLGGLT